MRNLPFLLWLLVAAPLLAQPSATDKVESGLGNGLNFSLNEDAYRFRMSGFVQPAWQMTKGEKQIARHTFRPKRTYLNFSGRAMKERITFLVQTDFSSGTPLLDAWMGYDITANWTVSVGQRRTFTNNREMTFDEDQLQFSDRGLLSTTFSGNGREFGLFVEGKLGKAFVLKPQFALTSGDGPNSFGINSTDADLGGLKWGGRLDVLPRGDFAKDNDKYAADLKHEPNVKIMMGVAGSYNRGASQATGEGHGDFQFFNQSKSVRFPDYRKVSADLLVKYKGFHLLAEWVNASATGLQGLYLDSVSGISSILKPQQISQFLILGKAWNAEAGYTTRSGYAVNVRYEQLTPEFDTNPLSLLRQSGITTLGLGRYFREHRLKLQTQFSQIQYKTGPSEVRAEAMVQVVF